MSPSAEPTGTPTTELWAFNKEAIKKGSYVAETGPDNSFIRDIALGAAGLIVLVLIAIFSHRTYKRRRSSRSRRRGRSSSRRSRSRRSTHKDYIDEGESFETPGYTATFDQTKDSVVSSQQSYAYSLEDGIVSPKSVGRDNKRERSVADSSAFSSEFEDNDTNVVDQMTKTVASFIDKQPKRVKREVFAPAGKLGIIVDTSSDGPIVHSIKGDSPLVGKVFTGDYIIAVDDEDTSDWSAHYVTKLVARKSGSVRKLTLMSNNWDD